MVAQCYLMTAISFLGAKEKSKKMSDILRQMTGNIQLLFVIMHIFVNVLCNILVILFSNHNQVNILSI